MLRSINFGAMNVKINVSWDSVRADLSLEAALQPPNLRLTGGRAERAALRGAPSLVIK